MTAQPDEAKLTAYALGELDEAARSAVEARMAEDPAARQAVEETRRAARILSGELAAEPAPQLTAEQRAAVEARAAAAAARRGRRLQLRRLWLPMGVTAAAAIVLIGVSVFWSAILPGPQPTLVGRADPDGDGRRDAKLVGTPGARGEAPTVTGTPKHYPAAVPATRPPLAAGPTCMSNLQRLGNGPDRLHTKGDPMTLGGSLVKGPYTAGGKPDPGEMRSERPDGGWNRESYAAIVENPFRKVTDHPLSTLSIDVDTASYANVRRKLLWDKRWPEKGAVRIEEMVNYFPYDYAGPQEGDEHPFAAHTHVSRCPWEGRHRLLRVALKGKEIHPDSRPSSNFVFLLDVSGSMRPANKLPRVKEAMKMLVERLGENDRVAIVVYAAATGLVLDSTSCDHREQVLAALDRLHAGGSTNGGAGIQLAYRTAEEHFITGGVNRVILCTDGDFNVGVTSRSELLRLIEEKARSGVFLSVLGFGVGNYQDDRMEMLADKGNGNYAYIDTINEARKVLVDQMTGTLVTIAKDVKIQVEFNPAKVEAYRLIGYENRLLAKEDFHDDRKDAGEIGAGHTVTALYELAPAGGRVRTPKVDPLKYQTRPGLSEAAAGGAICTVKLRYKQPDAAKSTLMTHEVFDGGGRFEKAPRDFRFATAVAAFGMILRDSKHKGTYTLDAVIEQAKSSLGEDPFGYRGEFVQIVERARQLAPR